MLRKKVTKKLFLNKFLTNKRCNTQSYIMLIYNGKVIAKESNIVVKCNDHYINVAEKSSTRKPCNFVSDTNSLEDDEFIKEIVQRYNNHLSLHRIRENFGNSQTVE